MIFWVVLALAGAAAIAVGVAMWNGPAGLVAAGVETVAGAYTAADFQTKRKRGVRPS